MDTQAVNSTGNPTAPKPKPTTSNPRSVAEPSSAPTGDTVRLSQDAQDLVQQDKASSSKITSVASIEQRKLSVTDNNDVVLEVIDQQTQKVVRTVPSEEQLELRDAIRDELDKI